MKPYLVLYATREGHTQRIAERIGETLWPLGYSAILVDVAHLPSDFSLAGYRSVIVAASVHHGKHEPELAAFVKLHRTELEGMQTAFLSVSLSEAGVERPDANIERHEKAVADVKRMIDEFLAETGWHPSKIHAVAGALLYTKYNFFLRFVMKRIAAAAGGDTDTSKDYDYTNWADLDSFVLELTTTKVVAAP